MLGGAGHRDGDHPQGPASLVRAGAEGGGRHSPGEGPPPAAQHHPGGITMQRFLLSGDCRMRPSSMPSGTAKAASHMDSVFAVSCRLELEPAAVPVQERRKRLSGPLRVAGFCLPKGLSPVLPIYLEGILRARTLRPGTPVGPTCSLPAAILQLQWFAQDASVHMSQCFCIFPCSNCSAPQTPSAVHCETAHAHVAPFQVLIVRSMVLAG